MNGVSGDSVSAALVALLVVLSGTVVLVSMDAPTTDVGDQPADVYDPPNGDDPSVNDPGDGPVGDGVGDTPDVTGPDGDAGSQDGPDVPGDGGSGPDVTDPTDPGDVDPNNDGATDGGIPGDGDTPTPDPEYVDDGVLGFENGYWYNQTVAIDQSDGLSDDELDALVSVTMARIEYIRGLEFLQPVDTKVMSRAEYRTQVEAKYNETYEHSLWNNQVWEALFVTGEDANVSEEFKKLYGGNVLGYYAPKTDEMVIVSSNPNSPQVDPKVLTHELVHALQDQHFDLTASLKTVQDEQLGRNGLVEGEANYVAALYDEYCGNLWTCTQTPSNTDESNPESPATGVLIAVFHPYSDGPVWMEYMVENYGWDAITAQWEQVPRTTESIIHPGTSDESTIVAVEDRTDGTWTRFDAGQDGADVLGEASIYSMFYHLAKEDNVRVVNQWEFAEVDSDYDTFNYESDPSAGWAGDRIVPYQKNGEYGYVWVTQWDTERDAREFFEAYRDVLDSKRAQAVGVNTWVIQSGPFADAFHVVLDGTTVTIVNAPTVEQLTEIKTDTDVQVWQRR
ncbi:Hvo_1808 family surface protein [Haloarchaeobius sp. DFWS5]|uniref:Hvo_1808 family surface protein n=1 Tax=Haloarchaeobius sp. DFWS5 TaxID=3446114 RepID=UPI003EB717EB